jgi:uncharacterized protein (DUF39 family)
MGVVVKQAYELDAVEAATFSIKEGKEIILRFSEIHPEMVEHTLNGVQSMNHLYMSDNSVTAKIVATISISVDKSFSS